MCAIIWPQHPGQAADSQSFRRNSCLVIYFFAISCSYKSRNLSNHLKYSFWRSVSRLRSEAADWVLGPGADTPESIWVEVELKSSDSEGLSQSPVPLSTNRAHDLIWLGGIMSWSSANASIAMLNSSHLDGSFTPLHFALFNFFRAFEIVSFTSCRVTAKLKAWRLPTIQW